MRHGSRGFFIHLLLLGLVLGGMSCGKDEAPPAAAEAVRDPHSWSRPEEVAVRHLDLTLTVDFDARTLSGRATFHVENRSGAKRLVLDTRDLEISKVSLDWQERPGEFTLGETDPHLGQALEIALDPATRVVHVDYSTRPGAAALQWLSPEQTAGGRHPFLYTQSQPILARTWLPCQDSPGARMTYSATLKVPAGLLALMSAQNPQEKTPDGLYRFHMPEPIPCYLMALAVGDLEFRPLGERSGVYAEPGVVERAAWEFGETEEMMAAAETLYGPYHWERYDILVLPPSFPFGGMENPRLTFATPTILAGDRSLVSLIAHELAHSWSGNLVTNATWNDFWLNEGFTTYFERRIMEALHGREYSEMLAVLGLQDLERTLEELGAQSPDTHLYLNLEGRDPDEGMTNIAYEKGSLFLRLLEESVGREEWDAFLRDYFHTFAFQTMTTAGFLRHLREKLLAGRTDLEEKLQIQAWVYGPGLPPNHPRPDSSAFRKVEEQIAAWRTGTPARNLQVQEWTTHHWLHFLRSLPQDLGLEQMVELDRAFGLTRSGNAEILNEWLLRAIDRHYEAAYPALEDFLTRMGRRKFLKPLYTQLVKTPEGRERALAIYQKARPTYHAISRGTIDQILGWEEGGG